MESSINGGMGEGRMSSAFRHDGTSHQLRTLPDASSTESLHADGPGCRCRRPLLPSVRLCPEIEAPVLVLRTSRATRTISFRRNTSKVSQEKAFSLTKILLRHAAPYRRY